MPTPATARRHPTGLLAAFGAAVAMTLTALAGAAGLAPTAGPPPLVMPAGAAGRPGAGLAGGFRGHFHGGWRRGFGRSVPAYPGRYYLHGVAQARFAIASIPGRIGMIVAPVMLDGRGPFRFMIDTGATRTVLAESTLAKLNLKADPTAQIIVRGVSGRTVVDTVHVDRVDSGSMHFQNLTAPVLAGPVLNGLDGILGMDGLQGMTLSADFVRDQVAIGASAAARTASTYILRGRFVSQRLLVVPGHIGGVLTEAVIDTGATHTLGNAALLALLLHGRSNAAPLTRRDGVIDATQTLQPGAIKRIPSMQLGVATLSNLSVTFGDFPVFKAWGLQDRPALLLGMDVLGTVADFSIDYRRAELQVLPWPPAAG
ncbi:MAG TPA: aspartyl protease family protein [Steroidobacteraceae bacterium]|nr:aspartyl protease family protein [Steroidobacteraceae bacterium]